MRRLTAILFAILALATTVSGLQVEVSGTLTGTLPQGMCLYVTPVKENAPIRPDTLHVDGGSLHGHTTQSPWGVYRVLSVYNRTQYILPIYIAVADGRGTLNLAYTDKLIVSGGNADNQVLSAFNEIYAANAKRLWMEGKKLTDGELRTLLTGYRGIADSLICRHRPSQKTAQYVKAWATATTFEGVENVKFVTGKTMTALGLDSLQLLTSLVREIDGEMAPLFDASPRMALAVAPKGSLDTRIGHIKGEIKSGWLQSAAIDLLMSHYLSAFDYAKNFDAGEAEVASVTEKYGLDKKFIGEFTARKATIVGKPFPSEYPLYDIHGHKVDFSKFKGKYVYIDMWASWCKPCIREIPHLQKLEAELENKNVVFVSLSIDMMEKSWKAKVKELSLKGNQLLCGNNDLCSSLNVRGIPFFLIYDKDGNLYRYNAPRPSDPKLKPLLESLK